MKSEVVIVKGSFIDIITYFPEEELLSVTMNCTTETYYLDVPKHVFEAFKNAKSKGRFYIQHIRGKYEEEVDLAS